MECFLCWEGWNVKCCLFLIEGMELMVMNVVIDILGIVFEIWVNLLLDLIEWCLDVFELNLGLV